MSFSINNKLIFIDSFQFSTFLLDSFVKNVGKGTFRCFGQEFDSKLVDLVKQKEF